jgi:hypothetical protein
MIKSKDLTVLVVLSLLSGMLAFFISNALFSNKKSLVTNVEVVKPVSSKFDYLDKPYYAGNPLNPTKNIQITENNNQKPLGQ